MIKVEIRNTGTLKETLKQLLRRYSGKPREEVIVGFAQSYAIYVHEIPAHHVVGQWKFLETAYRNLRPEIPRIIAEGLRKGLPLGKAQFIAGLRVQREAQLLTPVDTSALRASAFTTFRETVDSVVAAAFSNSEQIRTGGK